MCNGNDFLSRRFGHTAFGLVGKGSPSRAIATYAKLFTRCREAGVALYDDMGVAERLLRVLDPSGFADDTLRREPEPLGVRRWVLMASPHPADARRL